MLVEIGIQLSMFLDIFVIFHLGRVSGEVLGNVIVLVKKSSEVGHMLVHRVAIVAAGIAVIEVSLAHEGVGIAPHCITDAGVVTQVSCQGLMVIDEFTIVYEGWILADLFADFAMVIEEPVEVFSIAAEGITILPAIAVAVLCVGIAIGVPVTILCVGIAIGITIAVLPVGIPIGVTISISPVGIPIAGVFEPHERVRVVADFAFHTRVFLQVGIELVMVLQVLRVVNQGWRLAKVSSDVAMAIKELIELRQVPAGDVIGLCCRSVLRGWGLRVSCTWEPQQRQRRSTYGHRILEPLKLVTHLVYLLFGRYDAVRPRTSCFGGCLRGVRWARGKARREKP